MTGSDTLGHTLDTHVGVCCSVEAIVYRWECLARVQEIELLDALVRKTSRGNTALEAVVWLEIAGLDCLHKQG